MPSRRRFVSFAIGGLAATACTPRKSNASGSNTTIPFVYDNVRADIPRNPKRVVVIEGRGDLEFSLLAGYPVIATGNGSSPVGQLPGFQYERLLDAGVRSIKTGADLDHELLAGLNPDLLVLRAHLHKIDYYNNQRLAEVAPVLPVEVNKADFHRVASDQLDLLGRTDRLGEWDLRYRSKVQEGRRLVSERLGSKPVAMLASQGIEKGTILLWTYSLGMQVAHDLGMVLPFWDPSSQQGHREVSTENLGELANISLIVHQTTNREMPDTVPTWRALPAVEAGRTVLFPHSFNNGLHITACAITDLLVDAVRSL